MKLQVFLLTLSASAGFQGQPSQSVERAVAVYVVAVPTVPDDFDFDIDSRAAERLAASMTRRKIQWAKLTGAAITSRTHSPLVVVQEPEEADVIFEITGGYDNAIAPYIRGVRLEARLRADGRSEPYRLFTGKSFEKTLPDWLPRLEQTIQSFDTRRP
jgi:hypothetical protein